jgi:chromosome segregation ATPase
MTNQTKQDDSAVVEEHTDASPEIAALKEAVATLEADRDAARAAQQSASSEALDLRTSLQAAQAQSRDAVMKYREARLAATPEVPPELVPDSGDISEIDRGMEAALRLVSQIRERAQEDAIAASSVARVPAGSPPRRAPDLSSLSASEKIRMGLERLSDNNGR